jgi:hypothetical protein
LPRYSRRAAGRLRVHRAAAVPERQGHRGFGAAGVRPGSRLLDLRDPLAAGPVLAVPLYATPAWRSGPCRGAHPG